LLNYLTWRDTKTSYIIFSKNVDVKRVINRSKELVQAHPNFMAMEKTMSDSCITYRFKQNGETSKECFMTLHVFDLGSRETNLRIAGQVPDGSIGTPIGTLTT